MKSGKNLPYLDPSALHAVGDLDLISKQVVDGLLAGLHPGQRPAAGVEFGGYRPYQKGDDLRHVDWRLWARSDRYWVRLADVEREIRVRILLDATSSMDHRDSTGLSKLEYAKMLAATLAQLALRQGDGVALQILSDDRISELDPGPDRSALGLLLHRLQSVEASGRWPPAGKLAERTSQLRQRQLFLLITDLHEAGEEIRAALGRIRSLGHEVSVFRLLARNETELDYQDGTTFEDLETGESIRLDPARFKKSYREAFMAQREELVRDLARVGVELHEAHLEEGLGIVLRRFLLRRRERG